jgi:hypothetical protein
MAAAKSEPGDPPTGNAFVAAQQHVKCYIIMKNSSLRQVRLPEFCALR